MKEDLPRKEWSDLDTKKFYKELLNKALLTISETGAVMVLGPMFVLRKPEENFLIFENAQKILKDKGLEVFNQIPFVDYVIQDAPFKYADKFDLFYKGLITSGKIIACYVLPGWESSEGTKQEIEYAKEVNIPVYTI